MQNMIPHISLTNIGPSVTMKTSGVCKPLNFHTVIQEKHQMKMTVKLELTHKMKSWTHFSSSLWAQNPNLGTILGDSYVKINDQIRSQFCTCHDSLAVVTCAKLWPDWIIRIKINAKRVFTRFQPWAHKSLVRRVPSTHAVMKWFKIWIETIILIQYYWPFLLTELNRD